MHSALIEPTLEECSDQQTTYELIRYEARPGLLVIVVREAPDAGMHNILDEAGDTRRGG